MNIPPETLRAILTPKHRPKPQGCTLNTLLRLILLAAIAAILLDIAIHGPHPHLFTP